MFIDLALLMLVFFLTIPAVTGYFAYSYGRSFWLWFLLGCFLPIIAHLLLALLCSPAAKEKYTGADMTRYEEEYMQDHIRITLNTTSGPRKSF